MEGWQIRRLGDVCEFKGGGTPSKAVDRYWQGDIPWVSPKDMKSQVVVDSIDHITREAVEASATSMIEPGSILIVVRSGILARTVPIAFAGQALAMNQDLKALCPRPSMDSWFLYYLLEAKMSALLALVSRGATVHRLITDQIRSVEFMMPPLPEQRRIVAILDEAFEGIATAKANAEKNLQNARELFESRVKSTFAIPADGWVECTLGSVCEMYQPKTITGKDLVGDGPYLVFGANGVIGRYTAYNHEQAEVLVTCRGATCGAINVSEPRSWVTGNAMVVRPLDGSLDKAFLEHLLRSGVDLSPAITGAAQPQITRTNLSPLMISFPKSVSEQRNLTTAFDELQSAADSLQDVYSRKLTALDELKKSLLHQAFTGALTAKSTDKQLEAVA